jgi:hypothetical protein
MITTLDRPHRTVKITAGDDDQPARLSLVEDLLGIASGIVLRQHVYGLHTVGQFGVRSFELDGIAAAQIPDVVENAAAFVADAVSDQYRRYLGFARGGAVAPSTGDGKISWRLEYPFLVALDGHDLGVHTDSRDAQHIRALDATTLRHCRLGGQLVHVR